MRLVITYDIADDSDRRRVRRTLEAYGAWQQYSVFEVDVTQAECEELRTRLESCIPDDTGDRVRLYRICESCKHPVIDIGANASDDKPNVL